MHGKGIGIVIRTASSGVHCESAEHTKQCELCVLGTILYICSSIHPLVLWGCRDPSVVHGAHLVFGGRSLAVGLYVCIYMRLDNV